MYTKQVRVKKLKESREIMELRQTDVSKDMGVAPTTVSGWENEQDTIPFKRLIQYANLYNLRLDYLFGISKIIYCKNKISLNYIDTISHNLRLLRKKHNKTHQEIAEAAGIARSSYTDYENGEKLISIKAIEGLLALYGLFSVDELVGRKRD